MQDLQVELIEESIGFTGRGLITGIVFFDFGAFQFPEREWNDAVVVIVDWWLIALINLVEGRTGEVELRFMEGSFWLSVRREVGDECQIQCIEGSRASVQFQCRTSAVKLLRSTLMIAARLQRICYDKGWRSVDVEALENHVGEARKLAGEH
ncbi:hypothetical protein [Dyella sp.]|jgi:hypothetical protein|uniref:hypothetical protein n=1 Tax=Dyella sp. TaxID=1869338 RepID=UPI002FDA1B11